jgi:hypothetical protein
MISRLSAFLLPQASQIKVILMALFYCAVSYQFFIYSDGFNPFYLNTFPITRRYIGLLIILSCLLLNICFSFFQKLNLRSRVKSVFEIGVVTFFTFLYNAINSKQILLTLNLFSFNLNLHTGLIIYPLLLLLFFTVKNSLCQNTKNNVLLLAQILLIYLSIFSIDSILLQDRSDFRGFNNIWFSTLFSLRPEIWTTLGTLIISIITVFWLKVNGWKDFLFQLISFFLINLQAIYLLKIIPINSFGFWHRSLFMIIFWDAFYYLFRILNKKTPSSDLKLRISLSLFYHSILFLVVIFVSYF